MEKGPLCYSLVHTPPRLRRRLRPERKCTVIRQVQKTLTAFTITHIPGTTISCICARDGHLQPVVRRAKTRRLEGLWLGWRADAEPGQALVGSIPGSCYAGDSTHCVVYLCRFCTGQSLHS